MRSGNALPGNVRRIGAACALACMAVAAGGVTVAAGTPPAGYAIVSSSFTAPPGVQTAASVTCPAPTMPQGGGAYVGGVSLGDYIDSSYPSGSSWSAAVTNASSTATQVWAVCANPQPGYTQVASAAIANPTMTQSSGSVGCPSGTRLLGGGASVSSTSSLVSLNSSYPTGTHWNVVVNNADPSTANTFKAYAVCSHYSLAATGYTIVVGAAVDNPAGRQTGTGFLSCPSGDSVLGGGLSSSVASTTVDINTTYPGLSGGGWQSWENNGSAADDTMTPYAICAHGVPGAGIPESPAVTLLPLAGAVAILGFGASTLLRRSRRRRA